MASNFSYAEQSGHCLRRPHENVLTECRAPADAWRGADLEDFHAGEPGLYLDMDLAPGDISWLSNHTILHARTAYRDHDSPELRRHLLRLWLSIETEP